jgi:glucokinase
MTMLIGVDVGGTNLRLGVVEIAIGKPHLIDEMRFQADFSALCKSNQDSPEQAWQAILTTVAKAVQTVRDKHPNISGVGIGFPGFIDPVTQKILQSPNLPGLSNVDLSADLSQLLAMTVVTENDALAAAYGEFVMYEVNCSGSQQSLNLIYLGLGTGVGGGLILNGQPFQGQHGVAMEVGHIIVRPQALHSNARACGCGNFGCMEQYASASGVAISYFEFTGRKCTAHEIAIHASAGDQSAINAYALAGSSLAQALAQILKVIDVTDVVIGGGMSAGWLHMEQAFTQQLDNDLIPVLRGKVQVKTSNMGDQAGIIGAAMLAHQKR